MNHLPTKLMMDRVKSFGADSDSSRFLELVYFGEFVCRGKAPTLSGCESRPATVVPAGSNRSGQWR